MERLLLASAVCLVAACGEPANPDGPRRRAPADKARLYGDPVLVPSRDGEAARRELALAGEITAVLEATDTLDRLYVDVEIDATAVRVVIGGQWRMGVATNGVPIADLVAAIVGGEHKLVLAISDMPAKPDRPPLPLALALVAIGLGASIGITLDRVAQRRRRGRPRRQRSGAAGS